MKKILTLTIAITLAAPVFGMHNQVIPLTALNAQPVVQENIPSTITVPKRNAQDSDYSLNTADTESLTVAPFAELISEAHAAGKDYLIARVDNESNGHTHCFDAKSLNAILKPNNAVAFRPSLTYNNPITQDPIGNAHYFAIGKNNVCTYKCSYNDFAEGRKTLAEWNTLFPEPIVIENPRIPERDVENQRFFGYQMPRWQALAISMTAGGIFGGGLFLTIICASNHCPF